MEKHIAIVGGRSRPSPAQISKNFKLYSECCPDEKSYIYSRDVRFIHKDEAPLAKSKMSATIEWPSGRWQFGSLQIMNPELRSLIEEGTIGNYGPPRVRFRHYDHYGTPDGPSTWLVGFHANRILAQRYVLMSDQEFKRLCGKWADWDLLMQGKDGKLPNIY